MTIGTIALALIAGSASPGEAPLFELVPVPPEYAAPMPAGGGARHWQQTVPPPPPEAMPPVIRVSPPPPPRPPRIATPLRPQNPGGWVTNDDYPAAAIRAEESGTVGFRLTVDETGRVTECDVTLSSGSAVLDATSCALMRRRASFLPARDAAGHGIPAYYSNRLRWVIPEDPVVPMASWSSTLRFTIGGDNQVLSCAYQGYAAPDLSERSPCLGISELPRETMRKLRGRTKGAVAIYIRYDHAVAGMKLPPVPAMPAKYKQIASWSSGFDVGFNGARTACTGTIDAHPLPVPAVTCESYNQYDTQTESHSVTATIRFFTDGDAMVAAALPLLGSRDE